MDEKVLEGTERYKCDKCERIEIIQWPPKMRDKIDIYPCDKCGGTMKKTSPERE